MASVTVSTTDVLRPPRELAVDELPVLPGDATKLRVKRASTSFRLAVAAPLLVHYIAVQESAAASVVAVVMSPASADVDRIRLGPNPLPSLTGQWAPKP